jgi:hypothetical protein
MLGQVPLVVVNVLLEPALLQISYVSLAQPDTMEKMEYVMCALLAHMEEVVLPSAHNAPPERIIRILGQRTLPHAFHAPMGP